MDGPIIRWAFRLAQMNTKLRKANTRLTVKCGKQAETIRRQAGEISQYRRDNTLLAAFVPKADREHALGFVATARDLDRLPTKDAS